MTKIVNRANINLRLEKISRCTKCQKLYQDVCAMIMKSGTFARSNCSDVACSQIFRMKDIPSSEMSRKVEEYLRTQLPTEERFNVREKHSKTSGVIFNENLRDVLDNKDYKVTTKIIVVSQQHDTFDVLVFIMIVSQYDHPRNPGKIHVKYIDSVKLVSPANMRTSLYKEILLGYMKICRENGYREIHLWSCPPKSGEYYIFPKRPIDQQNPTPQMLSNWYEALFKEGQLRGIASKYEKLKSFLENSKFQTVNELPIFPEEKWEEELTNLNGINDIKAAIEHLMMDND